MSRKTPFALFLIALSACAAVASAQSVYRCGGNSYGQAPCPGGTQVAVDDPRTALQKSQADAATRSDAKTADALEQARLKREAQAAARAAQAARTAAPPAKAASATASADARKIVSRKKGRRHDPEYFTAKAPDEKKKPAAKSSRKTGKANS